MRFVWREGITEAASPQIVVIERSVSTESYLSTSTIQVESDRLVINLIGSADIMQWIRLGLPLRLAPPVTDSVQESAPRVLEAQSGSFRSRPGAA